jgi:hypothetical protein
MQLLRLAFRSQEVVCMLMHRPTIAIIVIITTTIATANRYMIHAATPTSFPVPYISSHTTTTTTTTTTQPNQHRQRRLALQ